MTKTALTLIQSALTRTACAQRTGHDLKVLRASVEHASALSRGVAWERKAAAHAEFHCLLADATGNPVFAILARFISDSLQEMIAVAGPGAEHRIIASRRRLLAWLEARDADAAAWEMEDCMARLDKTGAEPVAASRGRARLAAGLERGSGAYARGQPGVQDSC